jgi:GTPase SAR1 family protein
LLEKPPLEPPYSQYEEYNFKVLLIGKSFCGKTTLLESLCLNKSTTFGQDAYKETPGIEITHIYWPVRLVNSDEFFVFDLAMWDCGKLASAKYDYIERVSFP